MCTNCRKIDKKGEDSALKNIIFTLVLCTRFAALFSGQNNPIIYARTIDEPFETKVTMVPLLSTDGRASDVETVIVSHAPISSQDLTEPYIRHRIRADKSVQSGQQLITQPKYAPEIAQSK